MNDAKVAAAARHWLQMYLDLAQAVVPGSPDGPLRVLCDAFAAALDEADHPSAQPDRPDEPAPFVNTSVAMRIPSGGDRIGAMREAMRVFMERSDGTSALDDDTLARANARLDAAEAHLRMAAIEVLNSTQEYR